MKFNCHNFPKDTKFPSSSLTLFVIQLTVAISIVLPSGSFIFILLCHKNRVNARPLLEYWLHNNSNLYFLHYETFNIVKCILHYNSVS